MNSEIRCNNYNSIIYKYITDNANQVYDFKHFSDNCADLKDEAVLRSEATRIAGQLVYYIREIKAMIED